MTLMKENHKYKEKMKMLQKPSETHYWNIKSIDRFDNIVTIP
jgi:hypothetical protein